MDSSSMTIYFLDIINCERYTSMSAYILGCECRKQLGRSHLYVIRTKEALESFPVEHHIEGGNYLGYEDLREPAT